MEPQLIEAARRGGREAFDAIVRLRLDIVYRTAFTILGHEADAQDATQETFVAAWRNLPSLRDADRFDAWLGRITINACRMALRRRAGVRDQCLVAILETRELGNANSPVLRYDPVAAVWEVGLEEDNYGGVPQVHLVIVDGHTGQILQFVERTWNFSVDGYP